ncbi:MAG: SPFH domain-containing protein [Lachnospiraceae bacterium]|jgi:membrane protease subunit (stomatin/prohibitin family)|nr:SPFH domain-containing protein [Lachnospiraceae bacterium]
MGLIKAFAGAISGTFADQWKDFVAPPPGLTDHVLVAPGIKSGQNAGRGANVKASENVITNGSLILVPEGTAIIGIEAGGISFMSTEPGGYVYDSSNQHSQSVFAGNGFWNSLVSQSWDRFKFGGRPAAQQKVLYINLKEIAGLRYGTQNPIRYRDGNYNNIMLAVTSFGNYSLRVIDPIALVKNLVPINIAMGTGEVFDISKDKGVSESLFAGFIGSLAVALSAFTKGGKSIDDIQHGTVEFAREINQAVEESYQWASSYGLEIVAVQPRSLDWDDPSIELVNKFNLGMMMQGNVGNAYAQVTVADGLNAAGNNTGGAGMMGVGMAGMGSMGMMGGMMQQPTAPPPPPPQPIQPPPEAVAPVAPTAPPADDPMTALTKLKGLADAGLITAEEFEAKRQEILSRI